MFHSFFLIIELKPNLLCYSKLTRSKYTIRCDFAKNRICNKKTVDGQFLFMTISARKKWLNVAAAICLRCCHTSEANIHRVEQFKRPIPDRNTLIQQWDNICCSNVAYPTSTGMLVREAHKIAVYANIRAVDTNNNHDDRKKYCIGQKFDHNRILSTNRNIRTKFKRKMKVTMNSRINAFYYLLCSAMI